MSTFEVSHCWACGKRFGAGAGGAGDCWPWQKPNGNGASPYSCAKDATASPPQSAPCPTPTGA